MPAEHTQNAAAFRLVCRRAVSALVSLYTPRRVRLTTTSSNMQSAMPTKAAKKPSKRIPPAAPVLDPRLEALAAAYAKEPRVTVGKLFASMGLRVDGKIFAMVVRGHLVFKLPQARVAELVAKNAGKLFEPGPGRVMKEWISMTATKPDALTLAREAFAFVGRGG